MTLIALPPEVCVGMAGASGSVEPMVGDAVAAGSGEAVPMGGRTWSPLSARPAAAATVKRAR